MSPAPSPLDAIAGFRLEGGSRGGALLVHGFTGTPYEMRSLGDALAALGLTVVGVRLPGHGALEPDESNDLGGWRAGVEQSLAALRDDLPGKPIVAVGLSMGALLALELAARHPDVVRAVVALSPALSLRRATRMLLWMAQRSRALRTRFAVLEKGESDIVDAIARAAHPKSPPYPLAAALSLADLQAQAPGLLPSVKQPLLIVHARHDRTCPLAGAALLARLVGSSQVEMHVLERSGHVITVDCEHDAVERLVGEFVERSFAISGARAPASAASAHPG